MDQIKITILEDGTIRTDNDAISGPNHASAEQFMRDVVKLTAGDVKVEQKRKTHSHAHGAKAHQH
jgi:hypothetical protein